jgi:diacylglycerol kinase
MRTAIKKHVDSYRYAFRGIWLAMQSEKNMIIHSLAALAVMIVNYVLAVTRSEWIITIMLISIVISSEIFNTAIEKLADRVTIEHDPIIGLVKDLAAGGVLVICIAAVACGAIIYWPYVF